jgi:hypothetical protein
LSLLDLIPNFNLATSIGLLNFQSTSYITQVIPGNGNSTAATQDDMLTVIIALAVGIGLIALIK